MNASSILFSSLTFFVIVSTIAPLCAQDWPQWRGPTRDGVATGEKWPQNLQNMKEVWRAPLGKSYSGPVTAGDRVFTTESIDKTTEHVRAFDKKTGKELWHVEWEGHQKVPFFAASNGDWIRSTPACDGKSVYIAGMRDVLVSLDAATGKENWRLDFVKDTKSAPPEFGFVCSPLVQGDAVYVQAGGAFCKVDKKSGKVLWKTLQDGGGMMGSAFSSPIMATVGGASQLVVQTRASLCGVNPEDGLVLWQQEIPSFRGMNILTPVVKADRIFTSSYT
jgi:outer membrane protein assembly factor BamB